ncbi:hypothetical protein APASM_1646 [Actinosynnema pretiosum subsp. pretiosum]|nr:hypothetical protein APASM_1646 [Actinosynnema pretiosum subsp. pretiosum]
MDQAGEGGLRVACDFTLPAQFRAEFRLLFHHAPILPGAGSGRARRRAGGPRNAPGPGLSAPTRTG